MATWQHRAEVTGTLEFPLDMLRYDACFPDSSEDVGAIRRTLEPRTHDRRETVALMRYSDGKHLRPFTRDRWRSFGWVVSDVVSRKV